MYLSHHSLTMPSPFAILTLAVYKGKSTAVWVSFRLTVLTLNYTREFKINEPT